MTTPQRITIRKPDDWHVHLRDGEMLANVVSYTTKQFARAIVMPNLVPPVTDTAAAVAYRTRIQAALPETSTFEPLMTCYLAEETSGEDLAQGFKDGVFTAAKLYPAGATTNSSRGVRDIDKVTSVLAAMEKAGMPLLVHGEVTDTSVDIFDREAVFIERVLQKVIASFPGLRVVMEHVTTKDAVEFVESQGPNLGATITPHHLEFNRNAMFVGGIRPHYFCLPVAKREVHRLALRKAATSGSPKFFLGTDSAPHLVGDKESACGCAGIFNAPVAMESYTKTFEEEDVLDKLDGFASINGPTFYGLPLNESTLTLEKSGLTVPSTIGEGSISVVPFHAGEEMAWRVLADD